MEQGPFVIKIYGSDEPCPSCLHSPSSKETMEWIDAAVERKFPDAEINIKYVDINEPETQSDQGFCEKILADEYFYPLVVADEKVIGEGTPKLKRIFEVIENRGFKAV